MCIYTHQLTYNISKLRTPLHTYTYRVCVCVCVVRAHKRLLIIFKALSITEERLLYPSCSGHQGQNWEKDPGFFPPPPALNFSPDFH